MSTRANVVLQDGDRKLFFYRHSDGYPEGVLPTLNKFCDWIKSGKIRNNLSQSSGWIIMLGAMEYKTVPSTAFEQKKVSKHGGNEDYEIHFDSPKDWKVGAYEPTDGLHGDIAYIYTINIYDGSIKVEEANYESDVKTFVDITENIIPATHEK